MIRFTSFAWAGLAAIGCAPRHARRLRDVDSVCRDQSDGAGGGASDVGGRSANRPENGGGSVISHNPADGSAVVIKVVQLGRVLGWLQ